MKKKLTIVLLAIVSVLIIPTISSAALQANPNTHYQKSNSYSGWPILFRQMEVTGGAMGLNETINEDFTHSGDSNNIDVHQMKQTEWGTIAILSASGYGNPVNDVRNSEVKSTTGNETGVYISGEKYEWVAGVTLGHTGVYKGKDARYFNAYGAPKIGDGIGTGTYGTARWHGARDFHPAYRNNDLDVVGGKGIFSYSYGDYNYASYSNSAARGVAVSGIGL